MSGGRGASEAGHLRRHWNELRGSKCFSGLLHHIVPHTMHCSVSDWPSCPIAHCRYTILLYTRKIMLGYCKGWVADKRIPQERLHILGLIPRLKILFYEPCDVLVYRCGDLSRILPVHLQAITEFCPYI